MATLNQITSIEQLEEAVQKSAVQPLLIFKHSTSCSISAGAFEALQTYLQDQPNENVNYVLIHVIEDRPVSNYVAEKFNVKHESPQALLVNNGEVVWNDSHRRITKEALGKVLV